MTKIYLVMATEAEASGEYTWVSKAFTDKTKAKEYLEDHREFQDSGYFRWDENLEIDIPCDKDHEDAVYEYGWFCFSLREVELVE